MNDLTVILTFFNEGVEFLKTLQCLISMTKKKFDIILINDNSNDEYDYVEIAETFGAKYIEHVERKGPAVSRDEGVLICTTEYFLLLDAHMRVYQDDWVERIVNELKKEEKGLLCCSTLALNKDADLVQNRLVGYGAFISLHDLDTHWITNLYKDDSRIPCVLGASYACSKKYWMDLNGLKGLKLYGLEEQLISMKVWLSGGKCFVLKDVCFGHIFRDELPASYEITPTEYYLNQLYVVELLYNIAYKQRFIRNLRRKMGDKIVNELLEEFKQYREEIAKEKLYYKILFVKTFDFIVEFNTPSLVCH